MRARRAPLQRIRHACALPLAVVGLLAVAPAALAAEPPTILSAGIDDADRLYVTWRLGPGTTFERAAFATSPQPDPFLAGFFLSDNLADAGCAGEAGCTATPRTTAYTSAFPIARDRRYFVTVTATVGRAEHLVSAVWVIDETKPLIAGDAPLGSPSLPTRTPAGGRLFAPAPSASLRLLSPPATIARVLRGDVRVRVRCSAPCDVDLRLSLNGRTLVRRTGRLPAGSSTRLAFEPTGPLARDLRGRARARLRIAGTVTPLGGVTTRLARAFTVRR